MNAKVSEFPEKIGLWLILTTLGIWYVFVIVNLPLIYVTVLTNEPFSKSTVVTLTVLTIMYLYFSWQQFTDGIKFFRQREYVNAN